MAVENRWFIIESVVVSQQLRQELATAEQIVWPYANPNLHKELAVKPGLVETRIDHEAKTFKRKG